MFKTILNSYNIMLKKLLASCDLLFLLEASPTSNVRHTNVVRISEVFNSPFVKIFGGKRSPRPIPYYCNSTSARKIYFLEKQNLTVDPKILRNILKVNLKESKANMKRLPVYIIKMKYVFYAAVHIKLRSRTRGLLL